MQKLSDDIILVITITLFVLLIISFIVIFIILYQKRHQLFVKEKQQLQSQFQQTLLQSQLEIQEQTLFTISQEIHDNIGQALSLVKLNIGTINITQPPETVQQKLTDSEELLGKATRDLRDLARGMNTSYITDLGLLRSVEYEVEMMSKTGAFTTQLNVEGTPIKLDAQKELILFRIIQEILNNIIKHARASSVIITVTYNPKYFSISIKDDGKGFDITLLDKPKNSKFGLGLRNMQNRAQLVGAEFSLTSIPEKGTSIFISLPLS